MKNEVIRISVAQINTTVGDIQGNSQKIIQSILRAQKEKSALVVFPEMTITGYPPEDLLFKENFIAANLEALKKISLLTKGVAAIVGFVDKRYGKLFNAAAVLQNGKIKHIYHKSFLPNYGVFDEKRYFAAGQAAHKILIGGHPIALTICEDIWLEESFVYQRRFRGSCSLLINLSASPYFARKQSLRKKLIQNLAKKSKMPVLYNNLVGGQDELVFDGGSLLANERGEILVHAKSFDEDFVTVDLRLSSTKGTKKSTVEKKSVVSDLGTEEEIYQALVLGTRDYLRKNGFSKALIGMSGGIDSALVGQIAADALGPKNVMAVTMPSGFTSSHTYEDAKRVASNLSMRCLEFKIAPLYKAFAKTLKQVFKNTAPNIAEENLQARIRGNLLMVLSNKFGYLVLTTGNKSEMATGYCTLYGDMAGGFAVLKDVPKTLVYRLVRYRNKLEPKNSVPESVLRRAPTAELRPNQKDQDTLPPYSVLDRFLEMYVEQDLSVNQCIRKGIARGVALKAAGLVDLNEYKRRQAPPGIKITPKAFGRDRRMPLTNKFRSQ